MAEPGTGRALRFAGLDFVARPSGALWWPERQTLILADLHLGRSERYARRGGPLLPPWDLADTLDRLGAEIEALQPLRVVSLGDGFDDDLAGRAIAADAARRLWHLAQGRDWIWVAGNHDPLPAGPGLPGRSLDELRDGIALRHIAGQGPDVSGHMHPVLRLAGRNWRCFVLGRDHLVLPAFGTYTGGLAITAPAFRRLVPQGLAICCSERMFTVPLAGDGPGMRRGSGANGQGRR
ncbi:ligase-associated DNA damage response endonuclease PdeM [Paracoccus siganidrum]|uniref:Ligase-associated DNA damage response endonuclease PdeM n=1 Tax=Paracoccus siganidrum TaxID=1276757 RepID=A0A419A8G0_9RHOB|nr:ligase-associated DNA damage response endonuclease PdeM [Paracoccus siganidrum]RJL18084.1 ligase-associated DNA damage response endonuclease PdeM [Paracoccus siganidrum]RMC40469.1 ligase-associated DNA damage response endonuclease PdeM [Paracoccus siganidrum]